MPNLPASLGQKLNVINEHQPPYFLDVQCQHLITALNESRNIIGRNTRPHDKLPSSSLGKDAWVTSLKVTFIHKDMWLIDALAYSFDMSSMGVYTTRYWQKSGLLVQELNVCTVENATFNNIYYFYFGNSLSTTI